MASLQHCVFLFSNFGKIQFGFSDFFLNLFCVVTVNELCTYIFSCLFLFFLDISVSHGYRLYLCSPLRYINGCPSRLHLVTHSSTLWLHILMFLSIQENNAICHQLTSGQSAFSSSSPFYWQSHRLWGDHIQSWSYICVCVRIHIHTHTHTHTYIWYMTYITQSPQLLPPHTHDRRLFHLLQYYILWYIFRIAEFGHYWWEISQQWVFQVMCCTSAVKSLRFCVSFTVSHEVFFFFFLLGLSKCILFLYLTGN